MRYFYVIDNEDPERDAKLAKVKAYCEEIGIKSGETRLTNVKHVKEIDIPRLRQLLNERLTYSAMAKELGITKSCLLRRAIEALAGTAPSNGSDIKQDTPPNGADVKQDAGWVEMEEES